MTSPSIDLLDHSYTFMLDSPCFKRMVQVAAFTQRRAPLPVSVSVAWLDPRFPPLNIATPSKVIHLSLVNLLHVTDCFLCIYHARIRSFVSDTFSVQFPHNQTPD